MKHISIIIPEGDCSLSNIEGTHQILSEVNSFLTAKGSPKLFNIQLVGLNKDTGLKKGFFTVLPDAVTDDITRTDLIIIPALQGNMPKLLEMNRDFIPWLIKHYKNGAELASLCIGSFLLASTGLLKGKKCSTHWVAANDFRNMFPDVLLVPDKVITDENGIYSSGGAYSSLNLIMYLVEKYAGRDAAIYCSKTFEIDIERGSQSQFIIFKGQKGHDDEQVKKAQEFIESNFQNKITVDQLAAMLYLSRRNFERRFKKATSNTVVEYIQRVKIEAAKISLETARENVNEVMYNVGYTDPKAFRNIFKRVTGLSPIQYRSKYIRDDAA
jgi:transcriptional regulator GlxA family with amidase domain